MTVRRDRYGRPYVKQSPDYRREITYTRATTVSETLEDPTLLTKWKLRQVAVGLVLRPDLLALAGAQRGDRDALNQVTQDALDAAASDAAANIGTALHRFTQDIDEGKEPFGVPSDLLADLDAYRAAMDEYKILGVEQFVVCDELQVAGTFDRLVGCPDGAVRIADVKTGEGAAKYGQRSIAAQLAIYAHSEHYDEDTGARSPLRVNLDSAVMIHLPARTGSCSLFMVDIRAGWEAAKQAIWVRAWRKKETFTPVAVAEAELNPANMLASLITFATSIDALTELWREHQSVWTFDHTELAKQRRAELETVA